MTTAMTGWKKLREPIRIFGDPVGAEHARDDAQKTLGREEAKSERTAVVGSRLRALREENHFADLIADTMRKKT